MPPWLLEQCLCPFGLPELQGWQWGGQLVAQDLQLAEHPSLCCAWPHPGHGWLLWKQHSAGIWHTGRCWGDYSSSRETQQRSHVNLYHLLFHWDSMVLYPLLPGNHNGYDFCFLWGCANRDFVHLDLILSKLQYQINLRLVFLLYVFYMLFRVF